jgi:L-2-hydroxyglutarate oxidase LhgO
MSSSQQQQVVIIGAGVVGLALGQALKQVMKSSSRK